MPRTDWWRHAVIYQVYPRSFADANGDGIGDLAGIRSRLGYLRALGVDAIWCSPWYPSPMADAGYDVTDHRDIDPLFGTLAEAEALIEAAHAHGIRVIVDVVPNHTSVAHRWFTAALADRSARDRFWFRPGRGDLPPNDWTSIFGGPAWTRVPDGDWYLHLFDPGQPDWNWDHPEVRAEFEDILRFWFDRGVDGIRIDSAALCAKDPALPDFDRAAPPSPHPYEDREQVHDIYRAWRAVADSYPEPRALIGEVLLADQERFIRYLRPDELHTAFNVDFLGAPWDAKALRACIDDTLAVHARVGAPSTWVLSNHDVTRHVTRFGRAETGFAHDLRAARHGTAADLALGTRRARAALLLMLALPGSAYLYQGEELGLPEAEDLPAALREDPIHHRSGGTDPGRDGCRVPLPWSAADDGPSWLPRPASWAGLAADVQDGDPSSTLAFYRAALAARRAEPGLGDGPMTWLDLGDDVLAFTRPGGFTCVVNLGAAEVPLPAYRAVILGPDGTLPPDTAAWLRTP